MNCLKTATLQAVCTYRFRVLCWTIHHFGNNFGWLGESGQVFVVILHYNNTLYWWVKVAELVAPPQF